MCITFLCSYSIPKDGVVLGVAYMGAPSVLLERLPGCYEIGTALDAVQKALVCGRTDVELCESSHGTTYVKKWNPAALQVRNIQYHINTSKDGIGGCI